MHLLVIPLLIWAAPACQQTAELPAEAVLTALDEVLSELGGAAVNGLSRSQRWRMISSVGTGLPPANFDPNNLPERQSRGSALLTVYCTQCHGIPVPQMHAAAEWPVLIRRMALRVSTLRDRMGGPVTRELVGDIRMSGFKSSYLPSPVERDTLIAYLQRNALPVVQPGELGDGPQVKLYVERCSVCHETPSPAAHSPEEWEPVIARMQANMSLMDVSPMDDSDRNRIVAYLRTGDER
jgi:cytochrome c5